MRHSLLLVLLLTTLTGACASPEINGSLGEQARPGAERSIAFSSGLPAASNGRAYDTSVAPVDETRTALSIGPPAAKGGQSAQQEAMRSEGRRSDREGRDFAEATAVPPQTSEKTSTMSFAASAADKEPEPPPASEPPKRTSQPSEKSASVQQAPSPSTGVNVLPKTFATVRFQSQSAQISGEARTDLDRVAKDASGRRAILLRAYASGNGFDDARKLALARGLSVRSYLIDRGLQARIEVAASASENGPGGDRVDVLDR